MGDSSRRSVLKTGLAAVGGVVSFGIADKAAAQEPSTPSTLSFDGRSWHLTSPVRQAGEFPDAGEQMLMSGELVHGDGSHAGDFHGTYVALTAPGHAGPGDASSLQTHTLNLADGTLVGTGTATACHDGEDAFAIVGGTGRYAGARGSYTIRQSPVQLGGDGTARITISLVP